MMPRLNIDFGRHRAFTAPAGMVLLCVASLLLLIGTARLWHAYDENDRVQSEQDAQRHMLFAKSHPPTMQQTPAAKLAQSQSLAVLHELTVPWQDLLSIVEDYPNHDVALIGIDQSPAQSQIRITAEAKDFDAMIAYLRYLQASVLLREAVLNDHVIETNEPGTPVRFQITAVWRKS